MGGWADLKLPRAEQAFGQRQVTICELLRCLHWEKVDVRGAEPQPLDVTCCNAKDESRNERQLQVNKLLHVL